MFVDNEAIDIAVLGVFFELKTPPDGRLSLRTLEEEWRKCRLRATDLELGVERLLARGHLRLEQEGDLPLVALTRQGHQHGRLLGTSSHMLQSLWTGIRGALGFQPRQSRHDGGDRHGHRRASDSPEMPEYG